jgi:hypothetical protein
MGGVVTKYFVTGSSRYAATSKCGSAVAARARFM